MKRDACIRFLSIGEGVKKNSSIFTRRYLRITCISLIARRCPKMFEHMLRNKCSETRRKSRRRFATRWSRGSETTSPRSLFLHRRCAAESESRWKDSAMKHRRRKKPSKNTWKSRKAPRKGFVMRKRMASKRPRRFICWVPSITAAMHLSNMPGELEIVRRQLGSSIIRHTIGLHWRGSAGAWLMMRLRHADRSWHADRSFLSPWSNTWQQ